MLSTKLAWNTMRNALNKASMVATITALNKLQLNALGIALTKASMDEMRNK